MIDTELVERANAGLHASLLAQLPAELQPASRILDVGCGTGAWLQRLQAAGFTNLSGVDADISQTRFAGAALGQADLNGSNWGVNGVFDLITAIEVIEHLDNIGLFLDNVYRHLADTGHFLLTTPNVESMAARLRFMIKGELKQFDSIGDQTHLTPLFLHAARRIFTRHGFRISRQWGYPETGQTVSSRPLVNWVSRIMKTVLDESVPGDNLGLLLEKATHPRPHLLG